MTPGGAGPADASDEEVALRVPLDVVCFMVERLHDFMGKTASSSAGDDGDEDDPVADILEDRGTDPVEEELRSLIDDLDDDAQIDLVALMWLGRNDDEWRKLRALAEQEHSAHTADYLLGTPLVADHLMAGLDRLGLVCGEH